VEGSTKFRFTRYTVLAFVGNVKDA